ncbi:hypothetical protein KXS07_29520 [Inquilinus limosus]|uniref:hypothetical protein n=1 Tax=Inquilinus limosus TaxID=171674 RepID=UPI00047AA69A|nr:hypothetical protein [Inquilinus limosus]
MKRPVSTPQKLQQSIDHLKGRQLGLELMLAAFVRSVVPVEEHGDMANGLSVDCHSAIDGVLVAMPDGTVRPGFVAADNPSFRRIEDAARDAVDEICILIAANRSSEDLEARTKT